MSKQLQTGIQLASVVDCLVNGPQPLGTEILGGHGNHDVIGGQQSVPTALIEIWRAVNQHDVAALNGLEIFLQSELLESAFLGRRPIVPCLYWA